jgi:hypothetical protein
MTELDVDRRLQNLRESFGRIKALLAWERLKRGEANARRPWAFQMSDSTAEELKNEYSFFLAMLLNTYAVLDDSSFSIPQAVCQDVERQLADLEWQAYVLQLDRRF